jgi:hypothetical protein
MFLLCFIMLENNGYMVFNLLKYILIYWFIFKLKCILDFKNNISQIQHTFSTLIYYMRFANMSNKHWL